MATRPVIGSCINRLARRVAPSLRAARTAAHIRNQCELIIGYHLASGSHADVNGETWLLDAVGPEVNRFVDLGANVGDWTTALLVRNPTAQGIAVEPGIEALGQLRARLPASVTVVPAAAGSAEGTASFFEQPEAGEHSSIIAGWVQEAQRRQVQVVTVDALLDRHGWDRLDFLKIDTEGYDGHALEGASQALRDHRIGLVQFEYNRPWREAGTTLGGVLRSLGNVGYEIRVLRPHSLDAYEYEPFGEFFSYSNFVALSPASHLFSRVHSEREDQPC